ncbi:MAG: SMC-Scp complex subunit ScpB [Candidatus Paceibacterota bacterium]
MDTDRAIEALLFYSAEPMRVSELARILSVSEDDVKAGAQLLQTTLTGRGVSLVMHEDTLELRTHPDSHSLIEAHRKEELSKDIGKAGLETVAILLYRGASTRSEIDYIRGVNSSFILRHLTMRGLVKREQHKTDQRTFLYSVTTETLAHLGVTKLEDLPDFNEVKNKLSNTLEMQKEEENENSGDENKKAEEIHENT